MTLKEAYDKGFQDGLKESGDYFTGPFDFCEEYDPPKETEDER